MINFIEVTIIENEPCKQKLVKILVNANWIYYIEPSEEDGTIIHLSQCKSQTIQTIENYEEVKNMLHVLPT